LVSSQDSRAIGLNAYLHFGDSVIVEQRMASWFLGQGSCAIGLNAYLHFGDSVIVEQRVQVIQQIYYYCYIYSDATLVAHLRTKLYRYYASYHHARPVMKAFVV
jgi:hypothetical protein